MDDRPVFPAESPRSAALHPGIGVPERMAPTPGLAGADGSVAPEACDAVRRTAGEVRRAETRRPRASAAPRYQTRTDVVGEEAPPALVGLLAALRASVTVYVCGRRRAGAPIERVLPEIKSLVRDAESSMGSLETLAPLVAQVVGWTIEAYYDQPPRGPMSRAG